MEQRFSCNSVTSQQATFSKCSLKRKWKEEKKNQFLYRFVRYLLCVQQIKPYIATNAIRWK